MKNIFIAATLVLSSFAAMANKADVEKKVTYRMTQSLNQHFETVNNLEWTNTSGPMMRANFTNDVEQKVSAFFDEAGQFVASTIDLNYNQLPTKLQARLEKKLTGFTATEVVEMETKDETAFYVKGMHNGKEKMFKGDENGFFKEVLIPRI